MSRKVKYGIVIAFLLLFALSCDIYTTINSYELYLKNQFDLYRYGIEFIYIFVIFLYAQKIKSNSIIQFIILVCLANKFNDAHDEYIGNLMLSINEFISFGVAILLSFFLAFRNNKK